MLHPMPMPLRPTTPARLAVIIPIRPATDRTGVPPEQPDGSASAGPLQPDTVNAVVPLRSDEAGDTSTQRAFALNILCVLRRNTEFDYSSK